MSVKSNFDDPFFDRFEENFDKNVDRTFKLARFGLIVSAIFWLGLLGLAAFLIFTLL